MSNLQFEGAKHWWSVYRFRPSLIGGLITLCVIPLFIKLGMWQYNKAEQKQALQSVFEQYKHAPAVALPATIDQADKWKYRPVKVSGEYLQQYQILLDNQVEGERVGYHVITPLLMDQPSRVVLIDRGWVEAPANHTDLPKIETPTGKQALSGWVWVPSAKFYTLESAQLLDKSHWQTVWQNMDMKRYQSMVPYTVMPTVIRMDESSGGGGYVRHWVAPDDKSGMNLSYAYQWFGFALAAIAIYIFVSFKKTETEENDGKF